MEDLFNEAVLYSLSWLQLPVHFVHIEHTWDQHLGRQSVGNTDDRYAKDQL